LSSTDEIFIRRYPSEMDQIWTRLPVSFVSVNRRKSRGYREGWERHHILPVQSRRDASLRPFLSAMAELGFALEDFTTNGILLPCMIDIAGQTGLPLHVGGHPRYNLQVLSRMQAIRSTCETIPNTSERRRQGLIRLRRLQCDIRHAICSPSLPHIDQLILSTLAHPSVTTMIDRIERHIHARRSTMSP
jgi:A nuclease family of the HNH/ENDO VII superfamily with conserved AHH